MNDGLKGSVSDRGLDEKIERYKSSMAALDEQVNYLHMSTTVTVKASVSDMMPKVTNTEGIVIRTQGLAQAIDSRTSHMDVRIENRKWSTSLAIRFRRPKTCHLQAEQKIGSKHRSYAKSVVTASGCVRLAECK
jgi:hypothetical protein